MIKNFFTLVEWLTLSTMVTSHYKVICLLYLYKLLVSINICGTEMSKNDDSN